MQTKHVLWKTGGLCTSRSSFFNQPSWVFITTLSKIHHIPPKKLFYESTQKPLKSIALFKDCASWLTALPKYTVKENMFAKFYPMLNFQEHLTTFLHWKFYNNNYCNYYAWLSKGEMCYFILLTMLYNSQRVT